MKNEKGTSKFIPSNECLFKILNGRTNQKFPCLSFRLAAEGCGEEPLKNERKFLCLLRRSEAEAANQSLRDWKKVRAKVKISAQKLTSCFERLEPRPAFRWAWCILPRIRAVF